MGIWYKISSSASGTALRIASRTSFRTICTSLGFEAMYSFTVLKFVLAIGSYHRATEARHFGFWNRIAGLKSRELLGVGKFIDHAYVVSFAAWRPDGTKTTRRASC